MTSQTISRSQVLTGSVAISASELITPPPAIHST
jgi:hypothetical protein